MNVSLYTAMSRSAAGNREGSKPVARPTTAETPTTTPVATRKPPNRDELMGILEGARVTGADTAPLVGQGRSCLPSGRASPLRRGAPPESKRRASPCAHHVLV